jgi:integral membrane protein (TIGR01906 family)
VKPGITRSILAGLAGLATMITIVAIAVLVFLNPVYVDFGQGRAGSAELTGYDDATVQRVTNAILRDLVIGPPAFDVQVNGQAVLGERERAHMADVRNVFAAFAALAVLAVLVLVNEALLWRREAWFRRAVRRGAVVLAMLVIVLGLFAAVAFDTVFETFHELLFPAGSFDFAADSKLIQLFPDQFWFETSLLLAIVILVLSGLTAGLVRGGRPDPDLEAVPVDLGRPA